jgi:hypothetical protein
VNLILKSTQKKENIMKYFNIAMLAVLLPLAPVFAADHPCKEIRTACSAAGFAKGNHNGKSLGKDCVKPIRAGQTVAGVTIDPSVVQACNVKKAKHAIPGTVKSNR